VSSVTVTAGESDRRINWALRPSARAGVVVLAIAGAYQDTFGWLGNEAARTGAIVHLAVVAVTALFMAWVLVRRAPPPRPIHDRQVDYIVGIGLIVVAIAIGMLGAQPGVVESTEPHGMRALAIVPALAGSVAILYGVRRLWTIRAALLFLLLVLPALQIPAIMNFSQSAPPFATPGAPAAGRVAAAFLVAGTGMLAVAGGRPTRRVAWLIVGSGLCFALALGAFNLGLPVSTGGGVMPLSAPVDVLMILVAGGLAWPIGHWLGIRFLPAARVPSGAPAVASARTAVAAVLVAALAIRWLGGGDVRGAGDDASGQSGRAIADALRGDES
jgi:hypothetical protein